MKTNNIGVIGMAVMGSNLALNMADHGYHVAIYNRTYAVGEIVVAENPHEKLHLYKELPDFVASLEKPRKIVLMVQAGNAVDKVIENLIPLLDQGDIIMDGGNSNFKDTIRRTKEIEAIGLRYLGVGISGGEEGARFGPAIMPGGSKDAYQYVQAILEDISAKYEGEPCANYMGTDGAGHYVKMVHNGIEYADMQLIAESYAILKHVGSFDNDELASIFTSWNEGELESYLIEITAQIFKEIDPKTGKHMIDVILDRAAQKGTGKWTAEEALNTGTDASLLASSVFARFMSSQKDQRVAASSVLTFDAPKVELADRKHFVEKVREALYASKIIAYAQGFDLLKHASEEYGWDLDFGSISRNFREGCIIRARFLNRISDAYGSNPELANLMIDDSFRDNLLSYQGSLREVIALAVQSGISMPAFTTAISYFDAYRTADSSANLIQAQRDLFGAHTFERVDEDGNFHYEWNQ
ncbi:NADP-dependent phosphogluconate dehydrogenase [Erysipelothrix sp. HDW6C]|uniref:NADP-dependent phosphogluconate dehydrogenase n=1 Tax=Erysipelothrix sp. HDW6C TaxID=2714930 RepID=UPI001409D92B|nr:NADP-dependent phosphogluconate dehydrogenase [Erysipelothrix sp. HDW6C]QIK70471.1 NADP-dependent phosphogluconate dehydrogenase [Erysipelothrix sp. HDW6C]